MPPADGNRERLRPSLEGRKFSRYEILEPIGAGGMGEVYKARDLQLGRFVAVKTLRSSDEDSPEHARRLAREARFAAALDHPFICKVHDLVELETGETLLVMEYVEGRTLRAALEDGPLSQARAIRLATEVAEALEFAHAAGLMHRDMKPSNVMVTPNGHVKVMDFGIAKPDGPSEDSTTTTLTGSGRVVGTPAYMSPEQAKGRGVDKRTDIYSFGVMFYECLTGARPSTDGTTRWPDSTSVAPEVRQLVDRCLAPQPDARPESFSEIRTRLEHAGAALASSTGMAPAGRRRSSLVGVAVIVLAVIAIVLLVVFKDQWMRTETATTVAVQKPVVTWPSAENGGRISPDGSTVAFVSDRDGHRLWVRSVSGTEPKPITPAREDLRTPVWSPDGRQIAYLFKNSGGAWLEIISVWGESAGPARAIDASWDNVLLVKWIGSHLYLLRPQGNADALWRIDQTDNSLARVTRPGASLLVTRESDVANLDISLDETTLVFASPNPPGDDLVTAALDEGTPATLLKSSNGIRAVSPRWRGDSRRSVVYVSNENGQYDIWEYDTGTKTRRALTTSPLEETSVDVSRDGAMIVADTVQEISHLWAASASGDANARQLTNDSRSDIWPAMAGANRVLFHRVHAEFAAFSPFDTDLVLAEWTNGRPGSETIVDRGFAGVVSPDGTKIAFLRSSPSPSLFEVWVKELGSPGPAVKIADRAWFAGTDYETWTPMAAALAWPAQGSDALYFARLTESAPANSELVRARIAKNAAPAIEVLATANSPARFAGPTTSPDGQYLGVTRQGRTPFTGGSALVLDLSSLQSPAASVDAPAGRQLFTRGWTTEGAMIVLSAPRAAETSTEVFALHAGRPSRALAPIPNIAATTAALDPRSGSLLVSAADGGVSRVDAVDLVSGARRTVVNNAVSGVTFGSFTSTADGAIVFMRKEKNSDVWVFDVRRQP